MAGHPREAFGIFHDEEAHEPHGSSFAGTCCTLLPHSGRERTRMAWPAVGECSAHTALGDNSSLETQLCRRALCRIRSRGFRGAPRACHQWFNLQCRGEDVEGPCMMMKSVRNQEACPNPAPYTDEF